MPVGLPSGMVLRPLIPCLLLAACSPSFQGKDSGGPVADSAPSDSDSGPADSDSDGPDDSDSDADSDADSDTDTGGVDFDGDGSSDDEDCAPNDPSMYPGAPEIWYDGLDSDCAGDDDYDQDRDGVRSPEAAGADCNDLDGSIYPGAVDAWYDGLDSDCDGENDYDQDRDGYDDASGGGDDCDDVDDAVNPEATEVLDDGKDGDCNGSDDGPLFVSFETFSGSGVQGPRIAETTDSVIITVLADSFVDGPSVYTTGGITSTLDVADVRGGFTSTLFTEWGSGWSWDAGFDFWADDDYWVWAYGLHDGVTTRYLAAESYDTSTGLSSATGASRSTAQTFDDVELCESGDGSLVFVGCDTGGGVLAWMHGTAAALHLGAGVVSDDLSDQGSDSCVPVTSDLQVRVSKRSIGSLDLIDYSDASGLSEAGTTSGWTAYDMEAGMLSGHAIFVASEGGSGVYVEDDGSSVMLAVADADQVDVDFAGGVLYVAVTDGSRSAWLFWGSVASGFSSVELDTALPRVDDIAVHVTAAHEALIAVRGDNEVTYAVVAVR